MAQSTTPTKTGTKSTDTVQQDDKQSAGQAELAKKGARLSRQMDDLLDEIDEALEENAEDFVRSYVQRGGQ